MKSPDGSVAADDDVVVASVAWRLDSCSRRIVSLMRFWNVASGSGGGGPGDDGGWVGAGGREDEEEGPAAGEVVAGLVVPMLASRS